MESQRLLVGRVVKPHGIRGEVVVQLLSDAPDRFAPGAVMHCGDRDLTIEAVRPHQGRLLVTFDAVGDRTQAEALRGAALEIDASQARPLEDGSFYPHQLEGLAVVDTAGERLGTLVRVEENPAHDHWIVDVGARREVMVPAVRAIVRAVDLAAGTVTVDPPEGLF